MEHKGNNRNPDSFHGGCRQSGFTLLELLITATLIGGVFTLAGPYFAKISVKSETEAQTRVLTDTLTYSRHSAITMVTDTVLCPLDTNGKCGRNWNRELTLFIDQNGDGEMNDTEQILKTIPSVNEAAHRAFNNSRIRFNSIGRSGFQAGSLSYCNRSSGEPIGTALIISRMGRVRKGADRNRDGLPELANGNNIPCA